jgi:MFS family permease
MNPSRNVFAASVAHASNHLFQLVLPTILPLIVAEFNLSHFSAGLLLGLFSLPYAIFQLAFGEVSDRFGRKRLVVLGTLASSGTMFLIGLSKDLLQLSVLQVIAGITSAAYHPAGIPLVSESSVAQRRGRALGFHQMGGALGSLLPPVIMGAMAGAFGWRGVVIMASMVGFLSTLLSSLLLKEPVRPEAGGTKSTLLMALHNRSVLLLFMSSLVSVTAYRGIAAFATLYLVEGKGGSVDEAAIYYAIFQAAGVIGGPIGGSFSDRLGKANIIVAFVLAESIPIFSLPLLGSSSLAMVLAIIGLSSFAVLAIQDAYLSEIAPKNALGSSYGLLLTSSFLSAAYVPPIIGESIDRNGYEFSFALAASITLLALPLIYLVKRAAKK